MGKTIPSRPTIRKLQQNVSEKNAVEGSYTITVPQWWVKSHGMKKGAELFLAEDGFSLKFTPMKLIAEKKRAEIDVADLNDVKSTRYLLWTYYMQGADEFLVRSKAVIPAEFKKALREIRLDLPRIEVVSEDTHSVLLAVTLNDEDRLLDDMIREIEVIALSVHRDAVGALANGSVELAKEVVGREQEILRNYRAMIRKLAVCSVNSNVAFKSGIRDSRELITYGLVTRDLNRIVYHAIYIAKHVVEFGGKMEGRVLEKLRKMSATAYEMERLGIEAFLEKDYSKALKVLKRMKEVTGLDESVSVDVLRSSKNARRAVFEMLVSREIRRIAGHSVGIADAAANRILSPSNALQVSVKRD